MARTLPLRIFLLAWLGVVVACGAPPLPPEHAAGPSKQCVLAATERARVPGLLAEERLERTLRVIARANELCPETATDTWGPEVETLAEIGRYAGARALAEAIEARAPSEPAQRARAIIEERDRKFEATDDAKKDMRALFFEAAGAEAEGKAREAKAAYLRAWSAWRPNGQALYGAGRMAKALGEPAEAQRLFDRAIEELRVAAAVDGALAGLTLDVPSATGSPEFTRSGQRSRSPQRFVTPPSSSHAKASPKTRSPSASSPCVQPGISK